VSRLYSANSKTYVGSGKVQDIMAAVNATGEWDRDREGGLKRKGEREETRERERMRKEIVWRGGR
jgi:hypothetical protein